MSKTIVKTFSNVREYICDHMAEYFLSIGCFDVHADSPYFPRTEEIIGTQRNFRPAVTCRMSSKRAIVTDMVLIQGAPVDYNEIVSRMQLFSSAAHDPKIGVGQFHVIVPEFFKGAPADEVVRLFAEKIGVKIDKIHTVPGVKSNE